MKTEPSNERQVNMTLVRQIRLERDYYVTDRVKNLWTDAAIRAARQSKFSEQKKG